MNWLRRFMAGRYGVDRLQWALLIAYFLVSVIFSQGYLKYLSLIPLVFFWYRFLSRDVYRRSSENQKFMQLSDPAVNWFKRVMSRLNDREHRYYTCPHCKQTLRVPRGRGKITITCPNCLTNITKKT